MERDGRTQIEIKAENNIELKVNYIKKISSLRSKSATFTKLLRASKHNKKKFNVQYSN